MELHQPPAGEPLYTAQQVRDVELAFANNSDVGTYPLMEKAGKAAFDLIHQYWPTAQKILILTGKGNNGGDGYIVARLSIEAGLDVTLCNFCDPENIQGDAKVAFAKLQSKSFAKAQWQDIKLSDYDLVVDGLLGTGIKGAVREPFVSPIELLNRHPVPVLAIDIPSGLNANTGEVVNCAVVAEVTITYIGFKRGLYTGEAANYRGITLLDKLDIDKALYPVDDQVIFAHNWNSLNHLLPKRQATAHKGANGHCLIIGGADGMTGAAIMASNAAARSGAGLTSARLENGAMSLVSVIPEIMAKNISVPQITNEINGLSTDKVLVVGPGLGSNEWGQSWMSELVQSSTFQNMDKVIDADALNWIAKHPVHNSRWILTPHPGEAGRLLNKSNPEINSDRFQAAKDIASRFGGVCVLKGAGTVIADQSGRVVVCPVGNPGMASGGMGDVLSGIIGGLLAQGMPLFDAATLGVSIHGEAARLAAGVDAKYRGLMASDLIQFVPQLVNPVSPKKC